MYMEANFVEEILKCSYCRSKFTNVVKLVPECGSSICATCHDKLRGQLKIGSSGYHCQECNESHVMPAAGLSDNKALVKLIMLKNEPKTDKLDMFKKFQEEIKAKIEKLRSMDADLEVGNYCDMLVKQVMAEIDAAFNHLNKLGNGFLEKINEYRSSLLEPKTPSAKRFKSSCENAANSEIDNEESDGDQEEEDAKEELDRLQSEIEEYGKTLALVGSGMSQNHSIGLLETRIKRYQSRYERLETEMRDEIFHGRFMKFKPNPAFCSPGNLLGELVIEDPAQSENQVVEKREPETDPMEPEHKVNGEYDLVVKQETRDSRGKEAMKGKFTTWLDIPL